MPVSTSDVTVDAYFITTSDQLRKVTKIDKDDQGRDRVHYLSKSVKIVNRKFNFGHTIANPPLLDTFASDCAKQLDGSDVAALRTKGVILSDE